MASSLSNPLRISLRRFSAKRASASNLPARFPKDVIVKPNEAHLNEPEVPMHSGVYCTGLLARSNEGKTLFVHLEQPAEKPALEDKIEKLIQETPENGTINLIPIFPPSTQLGHTSILSLKDQNIDAIHDCIGRLMTEAKNKGITAENTHALEGILLSSSDDVISTKEDGVYLNDKQIFDKDFKPVPSPSLLEHVKGLLWGKNESAPDEKK